MILRRKRYYGNDGADGTIIGFSVSIVNAGEGKPYMIVMAYWQSSILSLGRVFILTNTVFDDGAAVQRPSQHQD